MKPQKSRDAAEMHSPTPQIKQAEYPMKAIACKCRKPGGRNMKRKPAITIRMSAAHGERYHPRAPHLYLGVHLLDGSKEAGGAVPWGLFAPKPSAIALPLRGLEPTTPRRDGRGSPILEENRSLPSRPSQRERSITCQPLTNGHPPSFSGRNASAAGIVARRW